MTLRLLTIAFFVLVYLLPLILRRWRGETTHDRHATARAERERAQLDADTAIAIKRAEVRREAEILWAEHQLTQARLPSKPRPKSTARSNAAGSRALEGPVQATSQRTFEPVEEEVIFRSPPKQRLLAGRSLNYPLRNRCAEAHSVHNLPAPLEPGGEVEPQANPLHMLIPSIPEVTRAAARWIRPLVPPFVARVIDNTTRRCEQRVRSSKRLRRSLFRSAHPQSDVRLREL